MLPRDSIGNNIGRSFDVANLHMVLRELDQPAETAFIHVQVTRDVLDRGVVCVNNGIVTHHVVSELTESENNGQNFLFIDTVIQL